MARGATNETMKILAEKFNNPAKWKADLARQDREQATIPDKKPSFSDKLKEIFAGHRY